MIDHGTNISFHGNVRSQECEAGAHSCLEFGALMLSPADRDNARALLYEELGDPTAPAGRSGSSGSKGA
jgi:hypothetical protein